MRAAAAIMIALLVLPGAAHEGARTLTYHFSVSRGRANGTITVIIETAAGADGGQVAVVTEAVERASQTSTTLRCSLYGVTTQIDCVPVGVATDQELSLLEFLGSSFYDPARLDAQRHWHRSSVVGGTDVYSDFTVDKSEGNVLTIKLRGRFRSSVGGFFGSETGTVIYDASQGVSESIRLNDFVEQAGGGGSAQTEEAFDLVSDSMAKTGSQNPH